MKSVQILEEKSQASDTPFMMICNASREKNKDKLEQALLIASCEIQERKNITPVAKLASENNVEAVEFLIKFGDATRLDAILGFALNGHLSNAHHILADIYRECRGNKGTFTKAMCAFALGLGMGGHLSKALDLLTSLGRRCHIQDVYSILGDGLLLCKHHDDLSQLIAKLKSEFPKVAENIFIKYKVAELIQQGKMSAFYSYLAQEASKFDNPSIIERLLKDSVDIFSYYNSSIKEYKPFLDTLKSLFPEQFSMILATAFSRYIQYKPIDEICAFFDEINMLYPKEFSSLVPDLVFMVASRGHKKDAHAFLAKVTNEYPDQKYELMNRMIHGLKHSKCYKEIYPIVEKLYFAKKADSDTLTLLNEVLIGILKVDYVAGKTVDVNLILKTIAMSDNHKPLEYLLKEPMLTYLLKEPMFKLAPELFERGKKIRSIMKQENLTYAQVDEMSKPEMRMFLLLGKQLIDRKTQPSLSYDTFFDVAKFLTSLSRSEVYDLSDKMALKFFKTSKIKVVDERLEEDESMSSKMRNCTIC